MALSVKDVLALPVLHEARVAGGRAGLEEREVRWIAVIERPVENFVHPSEMVLTAGVGCDTKMLVELVREVIGAGAAGLCLGVGPAGFFKSVPDAIVSLADDNRFPVVELPWEVRFADITQAVVSRLATGRLTRDDTLAHAQDRFTNIVFEGRGFEAIAEELDRTIRRPVIIFDSEFRVHATSQRARKWLSKNEVVRLAVNRTVDLSPQEVDDIAAQLPGAAPTPVDNVPHLRLPHGTAMTVVTNGQRVGCIYALGTESARSFRIRVARSMENAALAVAIEASRRRAAAEAEDRVRGHFLWSLASHKVSEHDEAAAKARLLGYDLRDCYDVILVQVSSTSNSADLGDVHSLISSAIARLSRKLGTDSTAARRDDQWLVLVKLADLRGSLRELATTLLDELGPLDGASVTCCLASEPRPLADLRTACDEVFRTLAVRRALGRKDSIVEARELRPFNMLVGIAEDPTLVDTAIEVLRPLLDYDRKHSRDFLQTLEIFLEVNGNTSEVARRTYRNRHSLLYRLKRIEELTRCSLASHQDRFLLDLSIRILRLAKSDKAILDKDTMRL